MSRLKHLAVKNWLASVILALVVGRLPFPIAVAESVSSAGAGQTGAQAGALSEAQTEIKVPEGSLEELFQFIEKLSQESGPVDPQGMIKFRQKQARAILEAADKILSQVENDAATIDKALHWKFQALVTLVRLRDPQAGELIPQLAKQLVSLAEKILAAQPPVAEKDAELAVQWALMGPRLVGPDLLLDVIKLPEKLEKLGFGKLARKARGSVLALRVQIHTEKEREELSREVKEYLDAIVHSLTEAGPTDESELATLLQILGPLEYSRLDVPAGQYCQKIGEILAKNTNPAIAQAGEQLQGIGRRLELPGKKMELAGKTVDGKDFSWSQYRGKVVLVDFFATWCGPCRAEMPNIKANYERYHNKGFEVVGISIDDDRSALEKYLESEKIPWTIIHVQDPNAQGSADPARYYGIVAVPTTMLVGKDGTVLEMNVRGERLGKKLEELLGPPETPANNPSPK